MTTRKTPKGASIAEPQTPNDARLFAPAAERNRAVLADVIADMAPAQGRALEIASGTGQHVVAFAKRRPSLVWQPTEIALDRMASIDAHVAASSAENVMPAHVLNATRTGWAKAIEPQSFVFLSNLLHLISETEAKTLIQETGQVLEPGGRFVIYGPFMRDGVFVSDGDQAFHQSLRDQDGEIGYKSDTAVTAWAKTSGLACLEQREMPANNLALIFEKITEA